jgi:nucleotide-binding universal stress UspA family protein
MDLIAVITSIISAAQSIAATPSIAAITWHPRRNLPYVLVQVVTDQDVRDLALQLGVPVERRESRDGGQHFEYLVAKATVADCSLMVMGAHHKLVREAA